MRPLKAVAAGLGLAAAVALASPVGAAPDKRPNILLILADDLGYSDIGPFGGEIPTPNLDALAREGRLLTAMYSTPMPVSRAEVMTGADHHLVGVGSMYLPWGKQKDTPYYLRHLNDKALTVAQVLKDSGYHTYMVGTWHLGEDDAQAPKAEGFESSFALLGAAGTYYALPKGVPLPASAHEAPVYREDANLVDAPTTYATDLFTDKLLSYLKRDDVDGRPFFAYAAYTAPHFPLQAPDEFIAHQRGRYDDGFEALRLKRIAREKALGVIPEDLTPSVPQPESPGMPRWSSLTPDQQKHEARRMEVYAAMIENLDWNIGRIVQALKASGRYDNTFIVFTSGNGAAQGFTDLPKDAPVDIMGGKDSWIYDTERWAEASNAPFALWKAKPTEGGISVPTIVHLPGETTALPAYREPATLKDLTPTFLDLAGVAPFGDSYNGRAVVPISGSSLLPMLEGKAERAHPADAVFADENSGEAYVRQGRWKAVLKTDQHTDVFERGDPLNAEHIAVLHTGDMQKAEAIRAQWPSHWSLYDIQADRGETHDLSAERPDVLKHMQKLYEDYRAANGVTDPL